MKVVYLCDRRKCENCNPECTHTSDIKHAVNFRSNGAVFEESRKIDFRPFCAVLYTASPSECFLGEYRAGCGINEHEEPCKWCRDCVFGIKN